MKKPALLVLSSLLLPWPASAGVLDRKGMEGVRTIAVVSVYAPTRVQAAVHKTGQGWAYIDPIKDHRQGDSRSAKEQPEADVQALYDAALAAVETNLSQVFGWTLVPFSSVKDNASYKSVDPKAVMAGPAAEGNTVNFNNKGGFLKKIGKLQPGEKRQVNKDDPFNNQRERPEMPSAADFRTAPGMLFIPVESITDSEIRIGNDPYRAQKERLAKLARDLSADAVAVVDLRLAYDYDTPVNRKNKDRLPGLPRVATRLLLVNKDGRVAGDTGPLSGDRAIAAEAAPVWLVEDGRLRLDDPVVRAGFETAIRDAAAQLKNTLSGAMQGLR